MSMIQQDLEVFPASPQQERVWLLLGEAAAPVYRSACVIGISGPLQPEVLESAWRRTLARHEILRTTLRPGPPGMRRPLQALDADGGTRFPDEDLSGLEPEEQRRRVEALLDALGGACGNGAGAAAPVRQLVHLGADRHALCVNAPAYVSDGPGLACLMARLAESYQAGSAPWVEDEPLQYGAITEWLDELLVSEDGEPGRRYWSGIDLSRLPEQRLPFEAPDGERRPFEPVSFPIDAGPARIEALESVAARLGVDADTVLLACWLLLLGRMTGDERPVVGVALDPRSDEELAGTLGPLVRFLPVVAGLAPAQRFDELVKDVETELVNAYEWQEYFSWDRPGVPASADAGCAFFPFAFEVLHGPAPIPAGGVEFSFDLVASCIDRFRAKLQAAHHPGGSRLTLHYDRTAVSQREAERLAERLVSVIDGAVADPRTEISDLEIVGELERRHLVRERNRTSAVHPHVEGLSEGFEAVAARAPDRIALSLEGSALSYRELGARADRVAARLRRVGVGAEDLVGVLLDRSPEMVVALLGILKAGGAYLPMDPGYPAERLGFMCRDAAPRVVVTRGGMADALDLGGVLVVDLDATEAGGESASVPLAGGGPERLAYAIYTSGSTGRPKGVMVGRGAILNRLVWMLERFPFESGDRVLQKTPFSFDASIWEIFVPLLAGAEVVLARPDGHKDSAYLVRTVARHRVTVLQAVPSLLRVILMEEELSRCTDLRRVFSGGEALSGDVAAALFEHLDVEVHNLYGPTESAIDATSRPCRSEEAPPIVPIGRPIDNVRIHVLDPRGRLAPEGVSGELCIAGTSLARGYLRRPAATAERFLPDPFDDRAGGRLYHTGDLCRIGPEGELEFLGRLDGQVKLRGYRIELGEIESALQRDERVREAAVALRPGASGSGDQELVAFVVPAGDAEGALEEARRRLADRLPEHMVPTRWAELAALPRTPSGKIDRNALPDPGAEESEGGAEVAPRTLAEELLAEIWAELLGRRRVGVHDDFFALGGHSLLATQLGSRIRQAFSVDLSLRSIFDHPTVAELAALVDRELRAGQRVDAPPILPRGEDDPLPLSYAQQRLWFLEQLEPGNPAYHITTAVRIRGPLSVRDLEAAIAAVLERHEVLRTRIAVTEGEPRQQILPAGGFQLARIDLTRLPPEAREARLIDLAAATSREPFDLQKGPLCRFRLVETGGDDRALLLAFHHLVSDGWSMGLFVRELTALYRALAAGEDADLPALPVQYADYALWQREWLTGDVLDRQLDYWRGNLGADDAFLQLPTDRPRPPVQTYRGAVRVRRLDPATYGSLRDLGRSRGVTPFMVLTAILQTLLARYSGQQAVNVGTPVAGRHRQEIEGMIGLFVNTLVLRSEISPDATFGDLLASVRRTALGAYSHQDVPFEMVIESVQPQRDLAYSPLFQVMLTFETEPPPPVTEAGLVLSGVDLDLGTVQFDLELVVGERGEALEIAFGYNRDLFDPATADRLSGHLLQLLRSAVASPGTRLYSLGLLGPAERQQTTVEWSTGPHRLLGESFVLRFERLALEHPDRVAVVEGPGAVTYGTLRRRARATARALAAEGVVTGDLVALLGERGADFLTSIVALFELGAAYLPLDPLHPPRKLVQVLADAAPALILADRGGYPALSEALDLLPGPPPRLLALGPLEAAPGAREAVASPDLDDVAYAIFTSGSTGRPKGAVVHQRGLVNHLHAKIADLGLAPDDTVAQTASQTFDISVWQLLAPLAVGGRTAVFPLEVVADPLRLTADCERHRVTVLEVVPSLLQSLLETLEPPTEGERLPALRWMIPTGEALPAALCRAWSGFLPRVPLLNAYGPTECSDDVSHHRIDAPPPRGAAGVPIGRPVVNTRLHVTNPRLGPVPIGAVGELLVGGTGVGRGYLGRPRLTAEAFVPDPFSEEPGGRAYRTGDVARFRSDGALDFLGRTDHQVKVRGFRIELGEVEAALAELAGVRRAVVIAADQGGQRRLVAYTVFDPDPVWTPEELRSALSARLPEPMVPSAFVKLEEIPLTPNGKVDRRALPDPGRESAPESREVAAPQTALERQLVATWEEVLDLRPVGVDDDFFRMGGHSLLAVRVVAKVEKHLGVTVPLSALFQAPTVRLLAARIEEGGLARGPLVRIQPGEAGRPPLYLVHPVGGTVTVYRDLARGLGEEQPVFGLQDPYLQAGLSDGAGLSLEEMASEYVAAILAGQQPGPVLLAGWSFGGLLAFEMARQMEEAGHEVSWLALLDTRPEASEPLEESDLDMLVGIARDLARRAGQPVALSDGDLDLVPESRRLPYILDELKAADLLPPELSLETVARYIQRRRSNETAAWRYEPKPYPGRILYFRATEPDPLLGPEEGARPTDPGADPTGGWRDLSALPVEVIDVPGYHAGLIFEPYVGTIAEQLRAWIARTKET